MNEDPWETLQILKDDYAEIASYLAKADTQCNRRTYIQRTFSLIEAVISLMRQLALQRRTLFSSDEITRLERRPQPPFENNVEFAIAMYSRAMGSPYRVDKNSKEWDALLDAKETRNKLAHPCKPSELTVSDKDIDDTGAAYQMVVRAMVDSLVQGADATYLAVKELYQQNGISFG